MLIPHSWPSTPATLAFLFLNYTRLSPAHGLRSCFQPPTFLPIDQWVAFPCLSGLSSKVTSKEKASLYYTICWFGCFNYLLSFSVKIEPLKDKDLSVLFVTNFPSSRVISGSEENAVSIWWISKWLKVGNCQERMSVHQGQTLGGNLVG